jgi:ABC-type proline/glycine betaine transport system ATPase subunit
MTNTGNEYIAAVKVNQYETGEETIHAADSSTISHKYGSPHVTTRCGVKYANPTQGTFEAWQSRGYRAVCTRCDQLIAKEHSAAFTKEAVADLPPTELLQRFIETLPSGHRDRAGIIRAIEVLETYSPKVEA